MQSNSHVHMPHIFFRKYFNSFFYSLPYWKSNSQRISPFYEYFFKMSLAAVVIFVMICLLIGIASFLFMREKPQKKNEKITDFFSEPTKVFDDCSEESSDTIKWSACTPKKMMSKAETRAKLLDFINSGEHLSVEVNKNIPESQNFVEECEKVDQASPLKRKIDKLKKGQIYESPKRYPSFIHRSYILTGQAALKRR